jgi:hypothetical protein
MEYGERPASAFPRNGASGSKIERYPIEVPQSFASPNSRRRIKYVIISTVFLCS